MENPNKKSQELGIKFSISFKPPLLQAVILRAAEMTVARGKEVTRTDVIREATIEYLSKEKKL